MSDWLFLASAIGAGVFAGRVAAHHVERLMQLHRDKIWRRDFGATGGVTTLPSSAGGTP